jgi:predicted GNAT family acetyltransferase
MCNLAHRFTNERWKEMHPEIQTEHDTVDPDELDDKLAAIKELINTKNQKQKIEIVKSYIKDKQHKQAKAYALYFSNMNVEKVS